MAQILRWIKFSGKGHQISCGVDNASIVVANHDSHGIFTWEGKWSKMPGMAVAVSRGADNSLWCAGHNRKIYRWADGKWNEVDGIGDFISVGADNDVAIINRQAENAVWRWNGTKWSNTGLKFTDLEIASDGTMVGCDADQNIWLVPKGGSATKIDGMATNVACGSATDIWAVNSNHGGDIWKWDATTKKFFKVVGNGKCISCAPDGGVALISKTDEIWCTMPRYEETANGFNAKWKMIKGKGDTLSLGTGSFGSLVVCNTTGKTLWRWTGSDYEKFPGSGVAIGCGVDKTIVCADENRKVKRWNEATKSWDAMDGILDVVCVSTQNDFLGANVSQGGTLWRFNGSKWNKLDGQDVTDIDIALDGSMICCNTSKKVYKWLAGETKWSPMPGTATSVGIGSKDNLWTCDKDTKAIHKWSNKDSKWKKVSGNGYYISVSYFDFAAIIGDDNNIWMTTY